MPKRKALSKAHITLQLPTLQLRFAEALDSSRKLFLQDALRETVKILDLPTVDAELSKYVDRETLSEIAALGMRGELVFPVPSVLTACPNLVAYYRLLLGYSQKEFYGSSTGLASFKTAESGKGFRPADEARLSALSEAMCEAAVFLIKGIGSKRIHHALLDDLTLLTLGPQFRGGANVKKGADAIVVVFDLIREIVQHSIVSETSAQLTLNNASGRKVVIAFASDPDIKIVEKMESGEPRNTIAIEIKGGTDVSNVHNRIGEAEKSHRNAREAGFVECWTIVNVSKLDIDKAKQESPSTNHFFDLNKLRKGDSDQFLDFRARIISLTGVKSASKRKTKRT